MSSNVGRDNTGLYPPHPRAIGWISIVALGLGGANLSLYTFQALLGTVGSIGILLFILGIILVWLSLPAYKEVVLMYPNMVGGLSPPCSYVLKDKTPIFACLLSVGYAMSVLPGISFSAIYFAGALKEIMPFDISMGMLATLSILVVAGLNLVGIRAVAYVAIPFAAISIVLAVISCSLPLMPGGGFDFDRVLNYEVITTDHSLFGSFSSIMAGLYLIAYAAPAIDQGLCYVGEVKDPLKNISKMLKAIVAVTAIYYIAIPIIWYGTIGPEALQADNLTHSLTPTFRQLGVWAESCSRLFIISNTIVCLLTSISCGYRILGQAGEFNIMPEVFARRTSRDIQWVALTFMVAGGLILTWIGSPGWLVAASNFDYIIAIVVAASFPFLIRSRWLPSHGGLYRATKLGALSSLFTAVIWLLSIIFGYQQSGLFSVGIGIAFFYLGLLFYLFIDAPSFLGKKLWSQRNSLQVKFNAIFFFLLAVDVVGYLIALNKLSDPRTVLLVTDIFVLASLLTVIVGLVLSVQVIQPIIKISNSAKELVDQTAKRLTGTLLALKKGEIEGFSESKFAIEPIQLVQKDEIKVFAVDYNKFQSQVEESTRGFDSAQLSLNMNLEKLSVLNRNLESGIMERSALLVQENEQLTKTLEDLRQVQDHLIQSKRMLTLAGLIEKISNQISVPMAEASSQFKNLEGQLKEFDETVKKGIKKKELLVSLEILEKNLGYVQEKLSSAASLMRNFKVISADTTSEAFREINLKAYINQIIESLRPSLKYPQMEINVQASEGLFIYCQPGVLFQIISAVFEYIQASIFNQAEGNSILIALELHEENIGLEIKGSSSHFEGTLTENPKDGQDIKQEIESNFLMDLITYFTGKIKGSISFQNLQEGGIQFNILLPIVDQKFQNKVHE